MSTFAIVTFGIIAVFLLSAWNGGKLPMPFRVRACQGIGWRKAFPDVPEQNIRAFLSLFVDAFAFKDSAKLQFNPNDKILEVYRSLYSHNWLPDALELEMLAKLIEKTYRVSFNAVWSEHLTLGELFAYSIGAGGKHASRQIKQY